MLDRVEWLHSRLRNFALARQIGREERDPYYYSIRDMLKAGRRARARVDAIEASGGSKLDFGKRGDIMLKVF